MVNVFSIMLKGISSFRKLEECWILKKKNVNERNFWWKRTLIMETGVVVVVIIIELVPRKIRFISNL